jgi:hypothetical protein
MGIKPIPFDPMVPRGSAKCRCTDCGEYFRSGYGFSLHRVGNWENGGANRRCLSIDEMYSAGWEKSQTGHWIKETIKKRRQRGGVSHFSLDKP